MADDKLVLKVTADTSAAEADLKDLDRVADQLDLDPKVDTSGIDKGSKSLADMADSAGMLPGPLGAAAGMLTGPAGIAAGAAAGAVGLYQIASNSADAALEAEALRSAVGGSVEETSRLLAATGQVGLEYNDVLELIAESNKAMSLNADEAKRLGVNMAGTPIERFQDLVDAVYRIEDPLKRSATAAKFFGEEGSKQLPKLIAQYGDLTSAMESVPELAVMSDEDVANARDFKQAMAGLTTQLTALGAELGKTIIPGLTKLAEGATVVAEGGASIGESFGTAVDGIGNLLSGDWDEFVNGEKEAVTATEDLAAASTDLGTAIGGGIVDGAGAAFDAISGLTDAMGEQVEATDKARDANEDLRDSLFGSADAALEAKRADEDMIAELEKFRGLAEVTTDDVRGLNDKVLDFANKQVAAAGTTRDTTEGARLYKEALNAAAGVLGSEMNPELQTYIDKANAVPDTAVTDIRGDLDPTEFNEADRLADDLERRRVEVQITANTKAFTDAAARVVSNAFGGRAQQTTAARYVWRNGRYVETG